MNYVKAYFTLILLLVFTPIWGAVSVTIKNHFNRPLYFVTQSNNVAWDLPPHFLLLVNEQVITRIRANHQRNEAYIRVTSDGSDNAFFGIEKNAFNSVYIHGYISKSIAYSWYDNTMTLCTSEQYKIAGYCI